MNFHLDMYLWSLWSKWQWNLERNKNLKLDHVNEIVSKMKHTRARTHRLIEVKCISIWKSKKIMSEKAIKCSSIHTHS